MSSPHTNLPFPACLINQIKPDRAGSDKVSTSRFIISAITSRWRQRAGRQAHKYRVKSLFDIWFSSRRRVCFHCSDLFWHLNLLRGKKLEKICTLNSLKVSLSWTPASPSQYPPPPRSFSPPAEQIDSLAARGRGVLPKRDPFISAEETAHLTQRKLPKRRTRRRPRPKSGTICDKIHKHTGRLCVQSSTLVEMALRISPRSDDEAV